MKKLCKICNVTQVECKSTHATHVYCDECKKTEKYKKLQKERILKRQNTCLSKPDKIKKLCKICKQKEIESKRYATAVYCDDCKQTEKYKQMQAKRVSKIRTTCETKYGVKNACLIKDAKGNMKRVTTYLERYKAENPLQNKEIHEKMENTNLKKYGYKNPFQNVEKLKDTWLKKYGETNPNKVKSVRDKIEKTCLERFGVTSYWKSETSIKNIKPKYLFTKPHRTLKAKLNEIFPNNHFETEKIVNIGNRCFSMDEIDLDNKIIILVDGDYWHRHPEKYTHEYSDKKGKTTDIWWSDGEKTTHLKKHGYKVLRFWQRDIDNNIDKCISKLKVEMGFKEPNLSFIEQMKQLNKQIK